MRKHAVPAAAAFMAVVVLTACGTEAATRSEGHPSAGPVAAPRIPSGPELPGQATFVSFADERSGFVILVECTGEETVEGVSDDHRCRQHVAVLEDGRWRLRSSPLPDVTGGDGITADIFALGAGRALITEGTGRQPDRSWYTDDGARTWRRGTTEVAGTVRAIPEAAALSTDCLRYGEGACVRTRLIVTMPDSGERRALATQPPLAGVVSPAGSSRDGGQWVSGLDPEDGTPSIAVSHDRGRTWRTHGLPGPKLESRWGFRVVDGGSVLYAAERGQLPVEEQVKNGLGAIHRSTDGGRTWERVWAFRSGHEPRSMLADPVAAADGSLTIYGEGGVYRSDDGGRGFREIADGGLLGAVSWTEIGYLWSGDRERGRYGVSTDGVHWHTFTLGRNG